MTKSGNGRNGLHVEVKKPDQTTIVMSKQGGRLFDDAANVAYELLQACECRGHYLMRVRDRTRMKGQTKMRVKHAIGQSIRVTIKPGDNTTAWDYDLVPPTGTNAEELCKRLQKYLHSPDEPDEPEDESEDDVEVAKLAKAMNATATVTLGSNPDRKPETAATMPPPVVALKPSKTLLQRVSELEQQRLRIEERKERITKLDAQKAVLLASIKAIDDEAIKIVEEDERDHEAQEAKEILDNLEKLFMKG